MPVKRKRSPENVSQEHRTSVYTHRRNPTTVHIHGGGKCFGLFKKYVCQHAFSSSAEQAFISSSFSSSSSSSFGSSSSSSSSLLMHQAMRTNIRTSIRTSTFYEYVPRLRNALSHRALALPHQRIQNERWRQIATWTMRQPTRWREHLLSRSRCRWHLQCMTIIRLSHVSMYKNIKNIYIYIYIYI